MSTLEMLAKKASKKEKEIIMLVLALDTPKLKLITRLSLLRMVELGLIPISIYQIIEPKLRSERTGVDIK